MADNVKIAYYARENAKVGVHSFFPQPTNLKTFGFDRMCKKAAKNTTIEEHTVRAAVTEYMKVAQEALLEGNRVEIGEQFVTLWPNLKGSVKDELNEDGTVKRVVTAKDLTANKCRSRVGATVNSAFSNEFARQVKWVKTDKAGNVIEEEDDTETNEEAAQQDTGQTTNPTNQGDQPSGGDNGGGDNPPSGGENEDGE